MPVFLQKARVFWPMLLLILLADCSTKRWAEEHLATATPEPVVGDVVRWTLSYNKAGAMGLNVGPASRPFLIAATLIALLVLFRLYRTARPHDKGLAAAAALIIGGALGNLIDRIRWTGGVIDFIDVGVGSTRFWIFNVADIGVSVGALLLAWMLWRQDLHRSMPRP